LRFVHDPSIVRLGCRAAARMASAPWCPVSRPATDLNFRSDRGWPPTCLLRSAGGHAKSPSSSRVQLKLSRDGRGCEIGPVEDGSVAARVVHIFPAARFSGGDVREAGHMRFLGAPLVALLIVLSMPGQNGLPRRAGSPSGRGLPSGVGLPSGLDRSERFEPVIASSPAAGSYRAPVPGPPQVLRGFSPPATPYGPGHLGVDLAAREGTVVVAAGAGTVRFAGQVAGRGVVVVEHPDGISTEYEPLTVLTQPGVRVVAGQLIGRLAGVHRGCPATGCLHWGARRGQRYLDPMSLLQPLGVVRLLPWDWVPPR
jgi:murein DD-endopeptidase MepM/ murein hydrolase activator NlpD